ncbi:MAG: GTP-binding protein [Actinomycetia bacterium]|nr:GTP-binding protein [Actinomycetes bacterium]
MASPHDPSAQSGGRIPVVALTGHLGAGKTSLLNHLLRSPGARLGVVVNDFGSVSVDAALVTGQVDQAASISGGCLCCLPGGGGLDKALARLAQPRLRLDAILLEASGAADPLTLSALIRFSGVGGVRPGGLVEVVDAVEHFETVDTYPEPPLRYLAASLVVVGKADLLPQPERSATVARVRQRVHERNPGALVVEASRGRVDPALVFDVASTEPPGDRLPLGPRHDDHEPHRHAQAVTRELSGPVAPGALVDLLRQPPPGAYRVKGRVPVLSAAGPQGYLVNVVGRTVHIASLPEAPDPGELVVIGLELDPAQTGLWLHRLVEAPVTGPDPVGLSRLSRLRRLSD